MHLRKKISALFVGFAAACNTTVWAGNLVQNGDFESFQNFEHLRQRFSEIKPTHWEGGDKLTYISRWDVDTVVDNNGGLAVWKSPGKSPDGSNFFVMADGDTYKLNGQLVFSDPFYQRLENLTIGRTYEVSFYQAAGQNRDRTGDTWEHWQVGFGNQYQTSATMQTPSKGIHAWQKQVLSFVAQSTVANLSFLAQGGPGSGPTGLPPVVFLDGVSVNAVPEPNSMVLTALGIGGIGGLSLWRRRKLTVCKVAGVDRGTRS